MKHSECPIRQTAVTHVGGADARGETSGPVRLTEALFLSQQNYQQIILQQGPIHPRQPAHPPFRTFYEQILTKIQHLTSPMWKLPQLGVQKKPLSSDLLGFFVLSVERERCFTETSTALVSPALDQYKSGYWSCDSRTFAERLFRRMSGRTCWICSPAGSSSAARPDLRTHVKQAGR